MYPWRTCPYFYSSTLSRRLLDEDDELSEVQPDAVPSGSPGVAGIHLHSSDVHLQERSEDKLRFRSVAHAIRAGIMVDKIYRRLSSSSNLQMPAQIAQLLKVSTYYLLLLSFLLTLPLLELEPSELIFWGPPSQRTNCFLVAGFQVLW
ncbi:hypothetical protein CEXT_85891 [Caerostris extrusa]|uniref:PDE1 N-terminal domain-containing protein n=1 Tax=Caerostris extrusa TaxID=172846 RepID=A0AAV4MMA9_CAEEX|nr:hypothetical protein CEXT_85891 [Caerostris extrusa]